MQDIAKHALRRLAGDWVGVGDQTEEAAGTGWTLPQSS